MSVNRARKNIGTKAKTGQTLADNKEQSAMEYLTTYGWAILIIAVAFIVLFELGIFNGNTYTPKAPPGSCYVSKIVQEASLQGLCSGELPEYTTKSSTNDFIIISNSSKQSSSTNIQGNQITITAWVDIYGSPYHDIVDKENQYGMKIDYRNSPHPCTPSNSVSLCLEWDTYNSWVGDSFPIPNSSFDKWMFVAVSMNGNTKYWYANGAQIGTFTPSNALTYVSSNLVIGAISQGFTGYGEAEWFNGSESNIQIYNTSLSPNDINALYLEGIGGAPVNLRNLVGWWPLNGNANDYSGNGNNGQAVNGIFTNAWENGYSQP